MSHNLFICGMTHFVAVWICGSMNKYIHMTHISCMPYKQKWFISHVNSLRDMTYSYVIWLIHMWHDSCHIWECWRYEYVMCSHSYVTWVMSHGTHDIFIMLAVWICHMSCVRHMGMLAVWICHVFHTNINQSYHAWIGYVTWLIQMSYVCCNVLQRVAASERIKLDMGICTHTTAHHWRYVTWLIHMSFEAFTRDVTQSHVTWLIYISHTHRNESCRI